jgi:hypothetical protein
MICHQAGVIPRCLIDKSSAWQTTNIFKELALAKLFPSDIATKTLNLLNTIAVSISDVSIQTLEIGRAQESVVEPTTKRFSEKIFDYRGLPHIVGGICNSVTHENQSTPNS